MKKFFLYIAVFACIIIVFDICFGYVMDYTNSHAKGGGVAKRYYICMKSQEDVLLMGSSRMAHHYIPWIIEDSLNLSCYNCGEDGNGIILAYGYLQLILKRYVPQIIIYDLSDFDLYIDDNIKYLTALKPYAVIDKNIWDLIVDISPSDKYKLYSSMYRYNSKCISNIGAMRNSSSYNKGFYPLSGVMEYEPEIHNIELKIDNVKLKYLEKFIQTCQENNIKLFFSRSPRYKGELLNHECMEFEYLCKKNNINFIDFYANPMFSDMKEYFKDQTHMNIDGANVFTNKFVSTLKEYLQ